MTRANLLQDVLADFDLPLIRSRLETRFRRTGIDTAEAQDLTQQCFLILLERLHGKRLDDPALADRFLFGIASVLIRARRKASREIGHSEMDQFSSSLEAPDTAAEQSEVNRFVVAAMHRLPKGRDRDILEKFYLRDEDLETISEDLKIKRGALKVALHRARIRFREEYVEMIEPPQPLI